MGAPGLIVAASVIKRYISVWQESLADEAIPTQYRRSSSISDDVAERRTAPSTKV